MSAWTLYLSRASVAAAVLIFSSASLSAQGQAEEIRVTLGKSLVIDYPEDVSRISTSNPDIVDYVPVSTREILLHAKGLGTATIVIWAKSGQRNFYNMTVEMNLEPIRKALRETFANEEVTVTSSRDAITLTGRVSAAGVADKVVALMTPFAKTVVNNMKVATPPVDKQILLRVKFAELNRTATFQFGTNLVSIGALNTIGATGTGQFSSARPTTISPGGTNFSITDALNIFAFRPDLDLAAFVRLLQQQGMLQILAEPNLVTSNGKEASFLVGGEFPVPVLQGGSNAGAVTIQFREFGIRLSFNPTMTDNKTLKMYVKPEVSTIDLANAVTFNGFTIPALATRRVESTIELGAGQSFVIGGLIDDRVNETMAKIPGLSDIPLLGYLFKSKNENRNKTELIVMVTPEFVEPAAAGDPKNLPQFPGEFLRPMMLPNGVPGSTNTGTGAPANKGPAATAKKDAWKRVTPPAGK
jgi:pilus assembly protein CpaC